MAGPIDIASLWLDALPVAEATRGVVHRRLIADAQARARIAKALGLDDLLILTAELKISPWLDGVEVQGVWRGKVEQTCGVTLDPFQSELEGEIHRRAAPAGSQTLGGGEEHELNLDPEADDPPDVLESAEINLAAYVLEELSLAIDPFPRKPGVEFEPPDLGGEPSPFAILAKLKGGAPDA